MKALAKLERAPGLTLTRVKKPEVGHNDVMIRIRKTAICGTDMHIWKWDEWAQKTIPVPMHVGHEYVGEIVEMGQEVRGFASRRPRLRRRAHHLRLLPQLPRRAAASVPKHDRRRRQPRGRVRRVSGDPGLQRIQDSGRYLRRPGVDLRSVRQRNAHRAVVQPGRRGRADHRRRSDRHHGRGDRPPRRRAPRGDHRRQRLPARSRAAHGRDARGQRRAARSCATSWTSWA